MSGPTLALALGGGGARGLAYIHVFEALEELGLAPCEISGSSIGAIMGAGYASGMTARDIRDYALTVLGSKPAIVQRLWRMGPSGLLGLLSAARRKSSGMNAELIVHAFLGGVLPARLEELKIPLRVVVTDRATGADNALSEGPLIKLLAASSAFPTVFQSVEYNGKLYADGGVANPVPFDVLNGCADVVLALDIFGIPLPYRERRQILTDMLFGEFRVFDPPFIDFRDGSPQLDVFVRPPVGEIDVFAFEGVRSILEKTEATKDLVKCAVEAAFENHFRETSPS